MIETITYRDITFTIELNEFDEWEANYRTSNSTLCSLSQDKQSCIKEMKESIDEALSQGLI